jgi:hypothetical protein
MHASIYDLGGISRVRREEIYEIEKKRRRKKILEA